MLILSILVQSVLLTLQVMYVARTTPTERLRYNAKWAEALEMAKSRGLLSQNCKTAETFREEKKTVKRKKVTMSKQLGFIIDGR